MSKLVRMRTDFNVWCVNKYSIGVIIYTLTRLYLFKTSFLWCSFISCTSSSVVRFCSWLNANYTQVEGIFACYKTTRGQIQVMLRTSLKREEMHPHDKRLFVLWKDDWRMKSVVFAVDASFHCIRRLTIKEKALYKYCIALNLIGKYEIYTNTLNVRTC